MQWAYACFSNYAIFQHPYCLFEGSEDVAKDKNLLIKHRVTHVLTVADTMKDYKPPLANIKHLFLNIRDLPQTQLHDYFSDAFSFIDECAADGGKVLVHCVAGKSRSASIVIAYMMKTLKMSFYSTFRLVKEKRPGIGPNHGFISQLKKFDEELHKDEF